MNILENKFYNEKPYLTANKITKDGYELTKSYIEDNNAVTCILSFCADLESVLNNISTNVVKLDSIKAGEDLHPIYAIENILFVLPFVGGPTAASLMEEMASIGVKNFLACGSAGLLKEDFDSSKLLIITEALRDEGTSYHYQDKNFVAKTDPNLTTKLEKTFQELNINYHKGKVWTTDAFYRETPTSIINNINNGIIAVDMECATWCTVANYLNIKFAQFLYFSDKVANNDWDLVATKEDRTNTKELITKIAYKVAKNI